MKAATTLMLVWSVLLLAMILRRSRRRRLFCSSSSIDPKKNHTMAVRSVVWNSSSYDNDSEMYYYSYPIPGRKGSTILNSLAAHAYTFSKGHPYGGICADTTGWGEHWIEYLDGIGLASALPFSCPHQNDTLVTPNFRFILQDAYNLEFFSLFTPEWSRHIRSQAIPPLKLANKTIAVHRPDSTDPCQDGYLPNSYFLELIHRHTTKDTNVIIFAGPSSSIESLNVFLERGYKVETNTPTSLAWKQMRASDIFITSNQLLSQMAAFTAENQVVFTPSNTWNASNAQPHWILPPFELLHRADQENRKMNCKS